MKAVVLFLLLAMPLLAQWKDVTYELKGGWNAIYLEGDATHATPDVIFGSGSGLQVEEVWRWNPNPSQVQFTSDPFTPTPGTPEWSTWYRTPPGGVQGTLASMDGQAAYLVKCSGAAGSTYSVTIKQKILPPRASWVRNGANLLGFPVADTPPTFSNYFATFPAAVAANSKIYRYVGGNLGAGNPLQLFNPSTETIKRGQAYWFEAQVSSTFYAPLEITTSHPDGLAFGRTGSVITVKVRNRTATSVSLSVTLEDSDPSPTGAVPPVPLTRIVSDTGTSPAFSQEGNLPIGPQSTLTLRFGIDRSSMSTPTGSLLRFTETGLSGGPLMDVLLPVSAQPSNLAGLWLGEVAITEVESLVATSPGNSVARPFPLRFVMHVDDNGAARLLSHAYVGALKNEAGLGVATSEDALETSLLGSARRYSSAHLPPGLTLDGFGTAEPGGSLAAATDVGFNDPTNPFVHRFHPDHNNQDERDGFALPEGSESYTIGREFGFQFAASPPPGVGNVGWGSTVLAGTYTETIIGAFREGSNPETSKEAIAVGGTFLFHRLNEIGNLSHP